MLDPACGSGNFLYVAYRDLRRIEKRLGEIEQSLRTKAGLQEQQSLNLFFPIENVRGIEIDPFGVQLARVTLWMGHKLAVDELGVDESVLPLRDLSGIQLGDALRLPWPKADAIVGNPPFHGDRNLRRVLGEEYVEWLRNEFGVGVKDSASTGSGRRTISWHRGIELGWSERTQSARIVLARQASTTSLRTAA